MKQKRQAYLFSIMKSQGGAGRCKKLAEIDENLARGELSPAERAMHVQARKEIYERKNGPAKAVGARASNAKQGKGDASAKLADASFTADTAAKTGHSERKVQRDTQRANSIPQIAAVVGTSLDKGDWRCARLFSRPPLDFFGLSIGRITRNPRSAPAGWQRGILRDEAWIGAARLLSTHRSYQPMTTRKITTPAYLEVRTEAGEIEHHCFDAVAASPELQARLLSHDKTRLLIALACLRGELKTAEDVVLTLDQWWRMMRIARKRGVGMPRVRVSA